MKKTFTSEQVGKWLAVFYKFSTEEEYKNQLHAIRCIFDANNDKPFWNEVCHEAEKELSK